MIRIFTDSASDLPKCTLEKYGITVLPLFICLGDDSYKDGIEITPREIYRWASENKTTPKTAAISLDETINAMQKVIDDGDEMIIFSLPASMSSTNNVMHLAAEEIEGEDKISIIDSENLSAGIGLLAIEASVMAKNGMTRKEIVKKINEMLPKIRTTAVADTLLYLHRGGRCSSIATLAGGILKIHPKLEVVDSVLGPTKKYRGSMPAVVNNYLDDLKENLLNADPSRIVIAHSGTTAEILTTMEEYVRGLNYFKEIILTRVGGIISSHLGPGTVGIFYKEK